MSYAATTPTKRSPSVSSSSSFLSFSAASITSSITDAVGSIACPTKTITRKRMSPAQTTALKKMFQAKSHPSKEERVALANEVGMELKAVTIWFQNRRQIHKRSTKENAPPDNEPRPARPGRSFKSASTNKMEPHPLRATISLDHIAGLFERPSRYPSTTPKYSSSPLTPRNTNPPPSTVVDKSELWKHMPSSPIAPPSSPCADTARFCILPTRSRTMKSLEWACARARIAPKREEDSELVRISGFQQEGGHDAYHSDGTATDAEEAITPDSSVNYSLANSISDYVGDISKGQENCKSSDPVDLHPSDEVEAAMVLLGFRTLQ